MVRFSAIVVAVVVSATAFAQSDPLEALSDAEAARVLELLQVARDAESAGRWLDAWAAYEGVHDIVILPEVRLREARALEELDRFGDAAAVYTELRESGGEVAAVATERLDALAADHPAVLQITVVGTPAHVTIDGADVGAVEGTSGFPLPPGRHAIDIAAPGYDPVRYDVELGYGQTDSRVFTFAAAPQPAPADPDDRRDRPGLALPMSLGGAAVAGLATGAVLVARRDAAAADARDEAEEGITRSRYEALSERYDRSHAGAIAAFSVGAGLAAAALTTALVRGGHDDDDRARIGFGVFASGDGASGACAIDW